MFDGGFKFRMVIRLFMLTGTIYAKDIQETKKTIPTAEKTALSGKGFQGYEQVRFLYNIFCMGEEIEYASGSCTENVSCRQCRNTCKDAKAYFSGRNIQYRSLVHCAKRCSMALSDLMRSKYRKELYPHREQRFQGQFFTNTPEKMIPFFCGRLEKRTSVDMSLSQ